MDRLIHKNRTEEIPAHTNPALELLYSARVFANQKGGDGWMFAVEREELAGLGLNKNDLRWLVDQQLVEHRREIMIEGDDERCFRSAGKMTFSDDSCFMLTELGMSIAEKICSELSTVKSSTIRIISPQDEEEMFQGGQTERKTPCWESELRVLMFDSMIVKRFKRPAPNQIAILTAFQEEGSPAHIDDPLSPQDEMDSKQRLRDTIKNLNNRQINSMIRFHGDGTGEGITWESV